MAADESIAPVEPEPVGASTGIDKKLSSSSMPSEGKRSGGPSRIPDEEHDTNEKRGQYDIGEATDSDSSFDARKEDHFGEAIVVHDAKELITHVLHVDDDPTLNPWTFRAFFVGKGFCSSVIRRPARVGIRKDHADGWSLQELGLPSSPREYTPRPDLKQWEQPFLSGASGSPNAT